VHRPGDGVAEGCITKCDKDSRWEESARTVGWVCRVGTMREHIREEWTPTKASGSRAPSSIPQKYRGGRSLSDTQTIDACGKMVLTRV
jgi:hypothetical protein